MPDQTQPLSLDEAIKIATGRKHSDNLSHVEIFFTKRLSELPKEDYEALAEIYYYLLKCKLHRNVLYETRDLRELYQKMRSNLLKAERTYLKRYREDKSDINKRQLEAFYKLATNHLGNIEDAYTHRQFTDNVHQTYEDKMNFRKRYYWFAGRRMRWLWYRIFELSSEYGNSFGRWGLSSLLAILVFAALFGALDYFAPAGQKLVEVLREGWYNYPYYSMVTFSTLGYGDIVPLTWFHKIVAGIEVIFGYFMLGVFINLMNKKL